MRARRKFLRDAQAVSPVIGSILVLFIFILATAGILLWGLPAIQGLQDSAEFQSVLTQSMQLNAEIAALRDPQNTRQITLSTTQGQLVVEDGSRWVMWAHTDATFTPVTLSGWESNTGSSVTVTGVPALSSITLDKADGGTFTNKVTSSTCTGSCVLDMGTYRLNDNVTRIQVKVSTQVRAEAWILEAGRITYRMDPGSLANRIHLEMGAVFTQQNAALFLEDRPSVKEPVFTSSPMDLSFLARGFQYDGEVAVSGAGRRSVQVSLVDNYGITRGRPLLDPSYSIRFQIDDGGAAATKGLLEEAFCNYMTTLSYYTAVSACSGGDVNVLYDPPNTGSTNNGKFSYQMTQSSVKVNVRAV